MNVLFAIVVLLQTMGTPIDGGSLIVSNTGIQFPALPQDSEATPINEDWELLYYEVTTGSDEYVLRGEIRNISPNPLDSPVLIVTVTGGAQIGIHPVFDQVGSGERVPFFASVSDEEITIALNESMEVEFTDVCENYRVVPERELSWDFQNIEIEYDADGSAVRVTGTVINISDASVEDYAPTLFGFAADGQFVGSIRSRDVPRTFLSGDQLEFEMNHGFGTYYPSGPFNGAGRDAVFVLAMAPMVFGYSDCVR